jgi:hypothetical protein
LPPESPTLGSSLGDQRGDVSATKSTTLRHHNAILRAGQKRADELEPKLVRLLTPALRQAGFSAARQFRAKATHHLTAAVGDPPVWTAPAPSELIDIDELIAKLKEKVEPARNALVENVMKTMVEGAGVAFDPVNPFAAKVLAQSGAHVKNIAATTQLNVMRIIKASYESGLSIPDTAKAIRIGMRDAAPARALTIARSELAAAANGASLAATQIVSSATGETSASAARSRSPRSGRVRLVAGR